MIKTILIILVALVLWLAFIHEEKAPEDPFASFDDPPAEMTFSDFACEGKENCSEMNSCDEAMFYLRNCPGGSKLDPDGDDIPCEGLCAGNW